MSPPAPPPAPKPNPDWPRAAALAALTVLGVVVCVMLLLPFLGGVTWGIALAVVALPVHRLIERVLKNRNVAAGVSTTLVVLLIGVPVGLVTWQLAHEARVAAEKVQAETAKQKEEAHKQADDAKKEAVKKADEAAEGGDGAEQKAEEAKASEAVAVKKEAEANASGWRHYASKLPWVGPEIAKWDATAVEAVARDWLGRLVGSSFGVVLKATDVAVQSLVAMFILFFALRDRRSLIAQARGFLPVATATADRILTRAADAIHATIYGTFVTAAIQGITGGLLFWAVGLPAPVLWGVVMTILGILPFVGAFIVWIPAAAYLALEGRWAAAAMIVTWGIVMAGPVCNYIYAVAAGDRMKMHPVPMLLAFIGGLAVFGISGMILGPCVVAVTVALIDVWRYRTADGTPLATREAPTPLQVP